MKFWFISTFLAALNLVNTATILNHELRPRQEDEDSGICGEYWNCHEGDKCRWFKHTGTWRKPSECEGLSVWRSHSALHDWETDDCRVPNIERNPACDTENVLKCCVYIPCQSPPYNAMFDYCTDSPRNCGGAELDRATACKNIGTWCCKRSGKYPWNVFPIINNPGSDFGPPNNSGPPALNLPY